MVSYEFFSCIKKSNITPCVPKCSTHFAILSFCHFGMSICLYFLVFKFMLHSPPVILRLESSILCILLAPPEDYVCNIIWLKFLEKIYWHFSFVWTKFWTVSLGVYFCYHMLGLPALAAINALVVYYIFLIWSCFWDFLYIGFMLNDKVILSGRQEYNQIWWRSQLSPASVLLRFNKYIFQ